MGSSDVVMARRFGTAAANNLEHSEKAVSQCLTPDRPTLRSICVARFHFERRYRLGSGREEHTAFILNTA